MSEAPDDAARPPSMWRDGWAWVSALSVVPLALATGGAPRGEAVAEDFDFLRRAMEPGISLLDGGGSLAFWPPVSHQLYYETFGALILSSPEAIAAVHVALLALSALLLYRALRATWPGPLAASAAAFPLMAESTRTLIMWPSHFVDLGAFLFLAMAYHELTRRRPWTASAALMTALLCKELALVGALLLPFAPGVGVGRRDRVRALLATGAVVLAWAAAYAWVRGHAGLELPHGLERDPALLSTALPTRLAWASWNSLRATWGLAFERNHLVTMAAFAAVVAAAVGGRSTSARADHPEPEDRGAFLDYVKLCRLQRMMRATRMALRERFHSLPRSAIIGLYAAPLSTEYAYGGPHALQVWYRDTTLSWIPLDSLKAQPNLPVLAFIGYQPRYDPQVVLVDGPAVRLALSGFSQLEQGRWSEALTSLKRAEAAQRDPRAIVFRGDLAGRRAYCEGWLAAWDEAERDAVFAVEAATEDVGARYVLALVHARRREWTASRAQLDTLLAVNPEHSEGVRLRLALDSLNVGASR